MSQRTPNITILRETLEQRVGYLETILEMLLEHLGLSLKIVVNDIAEESNDSIQESLTALESIQADKN